MSGTLALQFPTLRVSRILGKLTDPQVLCSLSVWNATRTQSGIWMGKRFYISAALHISNTYNQQKNQSPETYNMQQWLPPGEQGLQAALSCYWDQHHVLSSPVCASLIPVCELFLPFTFFPLGPFPTPLLAIHFVWFYYLVFSSPPPLGPDLLYIRGVKFQPCGPDPEFRARPWAGPDEGRINCCGFGNATLKNWSVGLPPWGYEVGSVTVGNTTLSDSAYPRDHILQMSGSVVFRLTNLRF